MNIFSSSDDDIPKASAARLFVSRKRAKTVVFIFYEHLFVLRRRYPEGVGRASLRFTEAREHRNLRGARRRRVIHTAKSGVF
jgi:hypothetical protein